MARRTKRFPGLNNHLQLAVKAILQYTQQLFCQIHLNLLIFSISSVFLQKHCDECAYSDVQCSDCHESVQKGSLEEHKLKSCSYRLVKCTLCEEDFPQASMEVNLLFYL